MNYAFSLALVFAQTLKALDAEGVPCSGGYHEHYLDGLLDEANLCLADRRDMDHIVEAVRKIQAHSGALAKASG